MFVGPTCAIHVVPKWNGKPHIKLFCKYIHELLWKNITPQDRKYIQYISSWYKWWKRPKRTPACTMCLGVIALHWGGDDKIYHSQAPHPGNIWHKRSVSIASCMSCWTCNYHKWINSDNWWLKYWYKIKGKEITNSSTQHIKSITTPISLPPMRGRTHPHTKEPQKPERKNKGGNSIHSDWAHELTIPKDTQEYIFSSTHRSSRPIALVSSLSTGERAIIPLVP